MLVGTSGAPGGELPPEALPLEGGESGGAGGVWRLILGVFVQNRLAVLGLGLVVFMVLFSFVGPHLYVTNQIQTNLGQVTQRPSGAHPLGTDQLGYDVLGRLMVGGQSSLEVGFAAAILASVWGTAWGAVAGYAGGVSHEMPSLASHRRMARLLRLPA